MSWFFATDLHGGIPRYRTLLTRIIAESPEAVLLGGDLLPSHLARLTGDRFSPEAFIVDFLIPEFTAVKEKLGASYPAVCLILGNDDPRTAEEEILEGETLGLWRYIHQKKTDIGGHRVYGYAYVPPTPFRLKDWERYDVSRYVDPGCLHPTEGFRTVEVDERTVRLSTIKADLAELAGDDDLAGAVFLFHSPPYRSALDRAGLDGKSVDHAPLDVHVGSIAIREFIEVRQPLVTLHGHVHESARITGRWRDRIGDTEMFSAAHDGPELALVRFSPSDPAGAARELL